MVNPVVSVEVFRAPEAADPEFKALAKRRTRLLGTSTELYKCLDANPPLYMTVGWIAVHMLFPRARPEVVLRLLSALFAALLFKW